MNANGGPQRASIAEAGDGFVVSVFPKCDDKKYQDWNTKKTK